MKLIINDISISFQQHKVLQNVSLQAQAGDIIAILGQNGAGKTTLFELLSGTLAPDAGTIALQGDNVSSNWQATSLGRLFQNTLMGCSPNLTVRENIALAGLKNKTAWPTDALTNSKSLCKKIHEATGYDLTLLLDKKMGMLSGGQRQLISFLLLTLNEPAVLLLDEPTAALDPAAATNLLENTLKWVRRKPTITFIITHDVELAKSMSTHIWLVEQGNINQFKTDLIGEELKQHLQPIQYDKIRRI